MHVPLLIVQRKVTLLPDINPVTGLLNKLGLVITAPLEEPDILHNPEPIVGLLPISVKLPLPHCSWSMPASEVDGLSLLVSKMSSKLSVQLPLLIVQRKVALLPEGIPVMVVVGLVELVTVAMPL